MAKIECQRVTDGDLLVKLGWNMAELVYATVDFNFVVFISDDANLECPPDKVVLEM